METAEKYAELWRSTAERATVAPELVERVSAIGAKRKLLVLLEDWCGDALGSVPYVAALADAAPNLELRVLARDSNLDIMDAHLTNGSRSIPVVIILDEEGQELGWWGPRPRELQAWVLGEEGQSLPLEDRFREVRRWYAKDRGRTALEELVTLLEHTREGVVSGAWSRSTWRQVGRRAPVFGCVAWVRSRRGARTDRSWHGDSGASGERRGSCRTDEPIRKRWPPRIGGSR